jgi:hypothetical protein
MVPMFALAMAVSSGARRGRKFTSSRAEAPRIEFGAGSGTDDEKEPPGAWAPSRGSLAGEILFVSNNRASARWRSEAESYISCGKLFSLCSIFWLLVFQSDMIAHQKEIQEVPLGRNTGDGYRIGAVRERTQFKRDDGLWQKRDELNGEFMEVKDDGTPFKGVAKEPDGRDTPNA